MPRITLLSITLLLIAGLPLAPASVVFAQSESPSPAADTFNASGQPVTVPVRGMVMDQVELRFGVPDAKLPAVGEPPISRWVYRDFTVYFEDRYVIHSVVHQ